MEILGNINILSGNIHQNMDIAIYWNIKSRNCMSGFLKYAVKTLGRAILIVTELHSKYQTFYVLIFLHFAYMKLMVGDVYKWQKQR